MILPITNRVKNESFLHSRPKWGRSRFFLALQVEVVPVNSSKHSNAAEAAAVAEKNVDRKDFILAITSFEKKGTTQCENEKRERSREIERSRESEGLEVGRNDGCMWYVCLVTSLFKIYLIDCLVCLSTLFFGWWCRRRLGLHVSERQ